MLTPTVRSLIERNLDARAYHGRNKCSSCAHACWIEANGATYENSGTMTEYMKFLRGDAEEQGNVKGYYRCYCRIRGGYEKFPWFMEDETPHIVKNCDCYEEYVDEDAQAASPSSAPAQRPVAGKAPLEDKIPPAPGRGSSA